MIITGHPPWPPTSGGRRREYELIKRLAEDHEIQICAIDKNEGGGFERDLVDGPATGKVFGAERGKSGTAKERAHSSEEARRWIRHLLKAKRVDLVHCEGYFLHQLLPRSPNLPVVVGTQNVEYELNSQRLGLEDPGQMSIRRLVLYYERKRELQVLANADRVIAVTKRDAEAFRQGGLNVDADVVPDGCDHLVSSFADVSEPTDLLFVGNFGYEPNRDAAAVLCNEIMPLVRRRRPETKLRLLGCEALERLALHSGPYTELVGPVDSVGPHLATASIVVAPLRVGGGVKVKVLEALHAGCAIVGSSLAAQGLEDHGGALIVEDDWGRFANQVVDLLNRESLLVAQRRAASIYASGLPRWDESATLLSSLWAEVCPSVVAR